MVGSGFIHDALFLAAVGSAGSVANALSRIFWGTLGDAVGYKVSHGYHGHRITMVTAFLGEV